MTIDRRDPSAVEVTLDPRERRYLILDVFWHDRWQSYGTQLWISPLSRPQDDLSYEGPDFREAVSPEQVVQACDGWLAADG